MCEWGNRGRGHVKFGRGDIPVKAEHWATSGRLAPPTRSGPCSPIVLPSVTPGKQSSPLSLQLLGEASWRQDPTQRANFRHSGSGSWQTGKGS